MRILTLILSVFILSGCNQSQRTSNVTNKIEKTFIPKYSKRFKVDYYNDFKVVSVINPEDGKIIIRYVLLPNGNGCPPGFEKDILVNNDAQRIVCLSTTHVAALNLLQKTNRIIAVANPQLIYDSATRSLLASEQIQSVGTDYNPDIEKIILLHPAVVFTDAEDATSSGALSKITQAKIPLVISNDYKEQSPLARAEWIKYFAVFTNDEAHADTVFAKVENEYLAIRQETVANPKTVFCNYPYQGIWYMPSKESYTTRLINDAGGKYLFSDWKATNGFNLSMNFEQVFKVAQHADIWFLNSAEQRLQQVRQLDEKLANFDAFKKQQVFASSKRITASGGIDYWESACFQPQLVLKDLHYIFSGSDVHPDSLFYFKQLR